MNKIVKENKIFEALLDVIPFASYAVDIETYEVVYANRQMSENMYAPREEFCWKKVAGQEEVCSWCSISKLKQREAVYKSEKLISAFFDEVTDQWIQSYDELVKWPDGRTVRYSILVDITEQKEIQANMIKTHTKLAIQTKKLQDLNKKLEYMARKDFLTGINNRGYFFELLNKLWKKKLQENENIYIVMFDLDKFKSVNDTYGHKAGDEVLKEFTNSVSSNLNEDDIFARLGGEEFTLAFVSDDKRSVTSKLEKIRVDVENLNIVSDEHTIKITVSTGVSIKEDEKSVDVVLDDADKQLYEAKTTGRNKVTFRI